MVLESAIDPKYIAALFRLESCHSPEMIKRLNYLGNTDKKAYRRHTGEFRLLRINNSATFYTIYVF